MDRYGITVAPAPFLLMDRPENTRAISYPIYFSRNALFFSISGSFLRVYHTSTNGGEGGLPGLLFHLSNWRGEYGRFAIEAVDKSGFLHLALELIFVIISSTGRNYLFFM
jgi:hypothetical protein